MAISVSVGYFNFIFFHKKDGDSASILNVVSRWPFLTVKIDGIMAYLLP
jgi:hypothetical protein